MPSLTFLVTSSKQSSTRSQLFKSAGCGVYCGGEAYTGEGAANTQCKREKKGLLLYVGSATTGLNTWCSDNKSMKFWGVLGAQGIRATGFKHAQGNKHCTKFESTTNT